MKKLLVLSVVVILLLIFLVLREANQIIQKMSAPVHIEKKEQVISLTEIVGEIQKLGQLETAKIDEVCLKAESSEEVLVNVFGYEMDWSGMLGESTTVYGCYSIIAGIDLIDFSTDNVSAEGNEIFVTIPQSEILHVVFLPEKLYTIDDDGFLAWVGSDDINNVDLMIRLENDVVAQTLETDLLEQADLNAEKMLQQILEPFLPTGTVLKISFDV